MASQFVGSGRREMSVQELVYCQVGQTAGLAVVSSEYRCGRRGARKDGIRPGTSVGAVPWCLVLLNWDFSAASLCRSGRKVAKSWHKSWHVLSEAARHRGRDGVERGRHDAHPGRC